MKNPTTKKKITDWFDESLAEILGDKIKKVYKQFDTSAYRKDIKKECIGLLYSQRLTLHAHVLRRHMTQDFKRDVEIFIKILGPKNPHETGMFSEYYWILPLGTYVSIYGLEHYAVSMKTLKEITQRSTAEYAVRPFIEAYPEKSLHTFKKWALSPSFHVRRLASEGLRPLLPWAKKLNIFIDDPEPVFGILDVLVTDNCRYVQRSAGNHIIDYIKLNPHYTKAYLKKLKARKNPEIQWILSYIAKKTT